MTPQELYTISQAFPATKLYPVLFLGHGSPMNAIEENEFVKGWRTLGEKLPIPKAILCISAHWETRGTQLTAMEWPRTIHDFGGFPPELYKVQYPAPGSPDLAYEIQTSISGVNLILDQHWGLDHGAWSVLKHLYPKAQIPVVQMSLDFTQAPSYHFTLGKELGAFREKGILIVCSGNMVHNLGLLNWNYPEEGYSWALEASHKLRDLIVEGDNDSLIHYHRLGKDLELSIPSPEHYLPLLYALGLKRKEEPIFFFNEKTIMGSISMTSLQIG